MPHMQQKRKREVTETTQDNDAPRTRLQTSGGEHAADTKLPDNDPLGNPLIYSYKKRLPMRKSTGKRDVHITRTATFRVLVARVVSLLDGSPLPVTLHAMGAAITKCCELALRVQSDVGGHATLDVQTGTVVVYDDYEPLVEIYVTRQKEASKLASPVAHLLETFGPEVFGQEPADGLVLKPETVLGKRLLSLFLHLLNLSERRQEVSQKRTGVELFLAVITRVVDIRQGLVASSRDAMSTWAPPAAPPFEETKSVCSEQEEMGLDVHVISCLEAALEKRREEASNAEAPMPMGVGTSSFRTADRCDPAASMHEDVEDDGMEDMEGEEMASDELSDDAVLGMMEEEEEGDGMTDGSDVSEDDDDDDDDNLAGYL